MFDFTVFFLGTTKLHKGVPLSLSPSVRGQRRREKGGKREGETGEERELGFGFWVLGLGFRDGN